jgi:hypothetical protein
MGLSSAQALTLLGAAQPTVSDVAREGEEWRVGRRSEGVRWSEAEGEGTMKTRPDGHRHTSSLPQLKTIYTAQPQFPPLAVTKFCPTAYKILLHSHRQHPLTRFQAQTNSLNAVATTKQLFIGGETFSELFGWTIAYIVKCYTGFCTQGALKWIRKKKKKKKKKRCSFPPPVVLYCTGL